MGVVQTTDPTPPRVWIAIWPALSLSVIAADQLQTSSPNLINLNLPLKKQVRSSSN